jgi:hypothetical protein
VTIDIPDSVTSIGNGVFSDCKNLRSIIPGKQNPRFFSVDGVLFDKTKKRILRYPAGKQDICYTTPAGVTAIGNTTFSGCENLVTIDIPDSIAAIDNFAFSDCKNLKSIHLSRKISISEYAFDNTKAKIFYTKVFNLLNGESRWDNQPSFWNDVCFYNYVQKLMDRSKQNVSSEYYENARLPFFEVLEKTEPDIVIVLGKGLYRNLPPSDGEEGKKIRIRGMDEFIEIWKYNINEKTIYAGGGIQHPSFCGGFKKDIWTKLCSKFLNEYEKGNLSC